VFKRRNDRNWVNRRTITFNRFWNNGHWMDRRTVTFDRYRKDRRSVIFYRLWNDWHWMDRRTVTLSRSWNNRKRVHCSTWKYSAVSNWSRRQAISNGSADGTTDRTAYGSTDGSSVGTFETMKKRIVQTRRINSQASKRTTQRWRSE